MNVADTDRILPLVSYDTIEERLDMIGTMRTEREVTAKQGAFYGEQKECAQYVRDMIDPPPSQPDAVYFVVAEVYNMIKKQAELQQDEVRKGTIPPVQETAENRLEETFVLNQRSTWEKIDGFFSEQPALGRFVRIKCSNPPEQKAIMPIVSEIYDMLKTEVQLQYGDKFV